MSLALIMTIVLLSVSVLYTIKLTPDKDINENISNGFRAVIYMLLAIINFLRTLTLGVLS